MLINLTKHEKELLQQYGSLAKRNIRRAEKDGLKIIFNQDYQSAARLFKEVAVERRLRGLDEEVMLSKKAFSVSNVISPTGQLLAAHFYDLDEEQKIVRLCYNASAYRQFPKGGSDRYLCGRANRYLFHQDFLHFQKQGYTLYDFGGYEPEFEKSEMASVNRFKAPFNGSVVKQYNYYPIWYYLIRQIRNWLQQRINRYKAGRFSDSQKTLQ